MGWKIQRIIETKDMVIHIHKISLLDTIEWLKKGVKDFISCPGLSVFYGVLFWALCSAAWFFLNSVPALGDVSAPLLAVVILVLGPISAMSLYSASKKLAEGEVVSLRTIRKVVESAFKTKGNYPSIFLSLLLVILVATWMMFSPLIYAIFHANTLYVVNEPQGISGSIILGVLNGDNLSFILTYLIFSGVFAWVAFMISWFSFPMVLDQDIDPFTAAITSFKASMVNKFTMIVWIPIVALLVILALLTPYFIGLIIVIPVLAHATWHAYRSLIDIKIKDST